MNCPKCDTEMTEEERAFDRGTFGGGFVNDICVVHVCPKCGKEIDKGEID